MAKRKLTRPDEAVTITDARAIRALAHPARLAVLDELENDRTLTATECADLVGLSASAMSYHLRALQRWGFVERADDTGDGRERPWRATSRRGWHVDSGSDLAASAAADALLSTVFDRLRGGVIDWKRSEPSQPKSWQDAGTVSSTTLWLTAAEARELRRTFDELVGGAEARTPTDHPRGARPVRLGLVIAPTVEG